MGLRRKGDGEEEIYYEDMCLNRSHLRAKEDSLNLSIYRSLTPKPSSLSPFLAEKGYRSQAP